MPIGGERNLSTFGQRLAELRRSKELSQKALAQELHLSQSTISCYELDKKFPPPGTLVKLAKLFNVSTDYLLGNADVPRPGEEQEEVAQFLARLQRLTPEGRKKVLYELRWVEQWEQKWRAELP